MVPFRLTCLGPPELHGPDGDPIRFRTRKHLALLIYLALEPSIPHRRDRLATLLWPHTELTESRHSLATALSILRGYLGADAFDARRDSLRLLPGRIVTDTVALDGTEIETRDLEIPGPFLEEFDIAETPDFDLWRETRNAEFAPKIHRVLAAQIEFHRRRGDARRVEALGLRLHRIDDVAEEGTRALIEARAMSGDRIGAIRAFDHFGRRLHDEMGAEPSIFVEKMADRLRHRGWERPRAATILPVAVTSPDRRKFVGRGTEFESCYRAIEHARQRQPRHVLVRGDSGIGKTTLVERFASAIALEGASVARVQCYELEQELPFGTMVNMVTQLVDLPGAGATAPAQLAELAPLVPRVRQRFPHLPVPAQSGAGESARLLFTEAIMALIAAVADEQPLIVVIDDMHLADATSLAVLHLMLRRIEEAALMMVLTSSAGPEYESANARRFSENVDSIRLQAIDLGPLTADEAARAVDLLLEAVPDPGPTLRRAILRTAEGNPMALALLVTDWDRRGDDCMALSVGAMTAVAPVPSKEIFRRIIADALATLDAEARTVMEFAAILGQRLNDLSLYALIDLTVSRTMLIMSRLTARHIFRDAGTHLEFTNEMMRSQCYHAMAGPPRRMLHGLIADRLLAQATEEEPLPGLEVAWHLVRAGRLHEAIPFLLAGGGESIQRGAPHEADLAFTTGLPALEGAPRRTAILLLAEARQELGRWQPSLELLDGAEQEEFSDSEESSRQVMRIVARRWMGVLTPELLEESADLLLKIIANDVEVDVKVKALAATVRLLMLTRNPLQTEAIAERVEIASSLAMTNYQRLHLALAKAWTIGARRQFPEALIVLEDAAVLARDKGLASSIVVRLLIGQGNLLNATGLYETALEPLIRAEAMARRLDNPTLRAECATQLALVAGRLGDSLKQVYWGQIAVALYPREEWSAGAISASYELGVGLSALAQHREAVVMLEEREALRPQSISPWARQAALLCEADVLLLAGEDRNAYAKAMKATRKDFTTLENAAYTGIYARWVALLGIKEKTPQLAWDQLYREFPEHSALDPKDEAEVIGSLALLEDAMGLDSSKWEVLDEKLSRLPKGIATAIRRLGIVRKPKKANRR